MRRISLLSIAIFSLLVGASQAPAKARVSPAPAPAVKHSPSPLGTLVRVNTLEGAVAGLRQQVLELKADSTLAPARRKELLEKLDRQVRSLGAELDELGRQVAAIPAGRPLLPNLMGLNADSLARALAMQMQSYMRLMDPQISPMMPADARVPGVPSVPWSATPGVPQPAVASRAFSASFAVGSGVERFVLVHRFGDVRVLPGAEGLVQVSGQVSVQGDLTPEEAQALADSVRVESESGTELVLAVRFPPMPPHGNQGLRVDVQIRVPQRMAVSVRNSYGDLALMGLGGRVDGAVTFGDLEAEDLESEAHLSARNGDLRVSRVKGPLSAENQFGTMRIKGVAGPAVINGVNSEMDAEELNGGAQVNGQSGSLQLKGVTGPVGVVTQNLPVDVQSVRGPLSLNCQYGRVTVSQISGTLSAQCFNGSLSSSFVEQAQDIQTRFCQVDVTNPGGDVKVGGESAPVLLRLPEIMAGRHYEATSRFGNVTLEVPERSSVTIHAATNFGSILSDLPLRRNDAGDWQRGETTLGQGGSQVSIQALSSSVRISRLGH